MTVRNYIYDFCNIDFGRELRALDPHFNCALPQLPVWDFWRDFACARARGIFLTESLSKVVDVLTLKRRLL